VPANPLPYLERASERIFQLESALFDAVQALKPAPGEPLSTETIEVDKKEYQCLLKCRAAIEKSFAQLGSVKDDEA
jgi:hypothetical protein